MLSIYDCKSPTINIVYVINAESRPQLGKENTC